MADHNPADLRELIARLEQAKGGSLELDRDIWIALGNKEQPETCDHCGHWSIRFIPSYTTSLDTALTLVPEGAWWSAQYLPNPYAKENRASASVTSATAHVFEHGATAPLALCIAALKSRLSHSPEPTETAAREVKA